MVQRKSLFDWSEFKVNSVLVQRGTFYVDNENFELLIFHKK